jgi:hypothetical protein
MKMPEEKGVGGSIRLRIKYQLHLLCYRCRMISLKLFYQIDETLRSQKFYPVIFIQLSPPEAELKVVRVVMPTCSEISHDSKRLGRRFLESYASTREEKEPNA